MKMFEMYVGHTCNLFEWIQAAGTWIVMVRWKPAGSEGPRGMVI
jgi:hypothetical protein